MLENSRKILTPAPALIHTLLLRKAKQWTVMSAGMQGKKQMSKVIMKYC